MKNKKVKTILIALVIIAVIGLIFYFVILPLIVSSKYKTNCKTFGSEYTEVIEKSTDDTTGNEYTRTMCCNEDKSNCFDVK